MHFRPLASSLLPFFFLLFALSACSTTRPPTEASVPDQTDAENEQNQRAEQLQGLLTSADTHFAQRTERAELTKAIATWEEAWDLLDDHHSDQAFSLSAYLARAYYFRARYHHSLAAMPSQEAILADTLDGIEAALRALRIKSPALADALQIPPPASNAPLELPLEDFPEEGVAALLSFAQNLLLHAETQGLSAHLEAEPLGTTLMAYLRDDHPQTHHGAPARYFGSHFIQRPFQKSPAESARAFEEALHLAPDFLLTRVLRAANLATATGDRELFVSDLQADLDTTLEASPEVAAENFFAQLLARSLLARVDTLF